MVNIGPKLVAKIAVSSTHFKHYVKHEGLILQRKDLCNEELNYYFYSYHESGFLSHIYIKVNRLFTPVADSWAAA